MRITLGSILILILIFSLSCSPSAPSSLQDSLTNVTDTLIPDSLATSIIDTASKQSDTIAFLSTVSWKTEDFIISPEFKKSASLRNIIAYTREEWKNIQSPFRAVYRGCDFGDYFHLIFEDAKGKAYDFGFGNNNYGDYTLFESEQYVDNKKYLNKTFLIHWTWKISKFPCCDGEYDNAEAYYPSITKLELIKE